MKTEPHIRWNRFQADNPEKVQWYFVVVNRKDRIETLLGRIYGNLENVEIELEDSGNIKDRTDLKYKLVMLYSSKGKIHWNNICKKGPYTGKIIHDEELRPRIKEKNGLENYVARLLS